MKILIAIQILLIRLWTRIMMNRLTNPMIMRMNPPSPIGMTKRMKTQEKPRIILTKNPLMIMTPMMYRMMVKLKPRTPTPPLTARKPMAIWIMTVSPMMLRLMPKSTPRTVMTSTMIGMTKRMKM